MTKVHEKSLLLVETEPKHAFDLQQLIVSSRLNYRVTLALSAFEALEGVRQTRWSAVLVDARWSQGHMEVLVQQLRAQDSTVPILVIVSGKDALTAWRHYSHLGIWTVDDRQFEKNRTVLMQIVEQTITEHYTRTVFARAQHPQPSVAPEKPVQLQPIAMIVIGKDGVITRVDPTAWFHDLAPGPSWVQTLASQWFHPDDGALLKQWIVSQQASYPTTLFRLRHPESPTSWVQASWVPRPDSTDNTSGTLVLVPVGYADPHTARQDTGVTHDTARRLHTEALRRFALTIVTQLANPFTTVRGHADLLLLDPMLDSENVAQVQTIVREARAAAETLSRLGRLANPPTLERDLLGLSGMLRKTVDQLAAEPSSKHVVFRADLPNDLPRALFDYQQLQLAFTHLMAAAARAATGQDKWVSIRAHATYDALVIEISDNGPYIDDQDPLWLIDPLAGIGQARQSPDKLALALAHATILEHGGKLSFANLTDRPGVMCTVTLPRADLDHAAIPLMVPKKPTVVIVEESEQIIRLIKRALRELSVHVTVVSNPRTAVEKLAVGEITAILCSLEIADGALPALLQHEERRMPGILRRFIPLSQGQPDGIWMDLANEHAMPTLIKPFSLGEVRTRIEQVLKLGAVAVIPQEPDHAGRRRVTLSIVTGQDT